MADQISFALILSKNLKLENLKLRQIETVIDIKGDTDPVTLQRMRDAVSDSFQARRKNLNTFIEKSEAVLAKTNPKKKRQQAAKSVLQAIDKQVQGFEKNLRQRIDKWCDEEEKSNAEFAAAQLKTRVSTAWSLGVVLKDTLVGIGSLFVAPAIPAASLALAKSIADFMLDVKGVYQDLRAACQSAEGVAKDITDALKKLKAIKKPKTVPKSLVTQLEKSVDLYKSKLDGVEVKGKALGKKLPGLLKLAEKPGLSKSGRKEMRDTVMERIKEIQDLHGDLKKGRSQYQSFVSKHKNAQNRQKTDAWYIIGWVAEVYDIANKLYGWTVEFDDVEKQLDKVITLTTKDDFFEPITG